MIGNSLTDEVKYPEWIKLVAAGGEEALYARKMIPGAPLDWHRSHPAEGFLTKPYGHPEEAFREYSWDVLTLQPFRPGEAESATYYAQLMWEKNPQARVMVYAQWPNTRNGPDWLSAWEKFNREQYQPVLTALRETEKGDQVFLIPAGHAMKLLHKKALLGEVPGIHSAWDLYSDGVHVNNIGSYLVGLSYYATIFGKDPQGLPVGGYQGDPSSGADYFQIDEKLAAVLQLTVWEAVTATATSGVWVDRDPLPVLPGLLPAVHNEPYAFELEAAYGEPPYRYSLLKGELPRGLRLESEGLLKGVPTEIAEQIFTVAVTDASGRQGSREYRLQVGEDLAPSMVTQTLPGFQQGAYLKVQLEAESGNPPYHWQVVEGSLPPGLVMEENGLLSGSPAVSGAYAFTLRVQDHDGAEPESSQKTFSGTIVPADLDKVVFVPQAEGALKADGVLSPEENWQLDQTLPRVYRGKSDNLVRWGAQWEGNHLWIAVEVTDSNLNVSEGFGRNRVAEDSVVFYFDGKNNREATYNFDDRRMAYGPVKKGADDRKFNIAPFGSAKVGSQVTEHGYILEIAFLLDRVGVPKLRDDKKTAYQGAVIGFDLENRDLDEGMDENAIQGWQGGLENPENPSIYGTLILE